MINTRKLRFFYKYMGIGLFLLSLILAPPRALANVIVDNGDSVNTSTTGTWTNSGGPGSYGTASIFARPEATHTWSFDSQPPGEYEVLMWWTVVDTRGTSIVVDIDAATPASATVDQTANGGVWNSLGTHYFDGAGSVTITATDEFIAARNKTASTSADAVWFRQVSGNAPPEITFFDITADLAEPGEPVFFDGAAIDSDGEVVSYEWSSGLDGLLSDQPSFTGELTAGTHLITLTVTDNEGAEATESQQVIIEVAGNVAPEITFFSVTADPPEPGEPVLFDGEAVDSDGEVMSYEWTSDLDGLLSDQSSFTGELTAGTHLITLTVTDNEGAEATESQQVVIASQAQEIIIDNGVDPTATESTGTWQNSGGPNSYGTTSVYARPSATYTWNFDGYPPGIYELNMWWTTVSTRGASIQVDITSLDGLDTVYVDQSRNGGQWNNLGRFSFDGTGNVTIYATSEMAGTRIASTSADAVQFSYVGEIIPDTNPPVADFAADPTTSAINNDIQFTNVSAGDYDESLWDFGDGATSTEVNPVHAYGAVGDYTVSLTVTNAYGSHTVTKENHIRIVDNIENIYIVNAYVTPRDMIDEIVPDIEQIGAVESSPGVWTYTNPDKGVTYSIREVTEMLDYENALRDPFGHIVIGGHSNYGSGMALINRDENGHIDAFDAPKWYNGTSDIVTPDIGGMVNGNDYVNWVPYYRDGTPAIAPYTFSEGLPPYNYNLSYEIPGGDGTRYFIERPDGSYFQRFGSDTQTPVWESPYQPDPVQNPEYFITNPDPEFNHIEFVGNWPIVQAEAEEARYYSGTNFQTNAAGTGAESATMIVMVRHPGWYQVYAQWQPRPEHATNAVFTINHASGSTPVTVDQTVSAGSNDLGLYYFNYGRNTLVLTDDANGTVCVDRVDLVSADDPAGLIRAEFSATNRVGSGPLTVQFKDWSLFYGTSMRGSYLWDFGDGTNDETNTERSPAHTYASPGVYTVTLTVTDSSGVSSTEVKDSFVVVDTFALPLTAQFRAGLSAEYDVYPSSMLDMFIPGPNIGWQQFLAYFYDQSTGNATSWHWDFGDGSTSNEQNPQHVYKGTGAYTVTLTVSGPDGTSTEEKQSYVNMLIGSAQLENDYLFKPHYYSTYRGRIVGKVMMDARKAKLEKGIDPKEYKYQRMAYLTCFTGRYYMDHYQRGIMFYTHANSRNPVPWPDYVRLYLLGNTDDQILTVLNNLQYETYWWEGSLPFGLYGYYDFTQKPPSMR